LFLRSTMHAQKIAELLKEAVYANLPKKVAVPFSGGLDSATLAKIASQKAEVLLITAGTEKSADVKAAREVAGEMGLPHETVIMDKEQILSTYEKCKKIMPGELLKVELMVPLYFVCEKARERGFETIMLGSGAEEVFIGYGRYFEYLEEGMDLQKILSWEVETLKERDCKRLDAVAGEFGISTLYPFLYQPLSSFALSLPLSARLGSRKNKKPLLREAAKLLGVPKTAYTRPKKAMQYGSGVHKILLKEFGEGVKGVSYRSNPPF